MDTAHHMLLYGCGEPGSTTKPIWNCGEMTQGDSDEDSGSPCAGGSHSQVYLLAYFCKKCKLELFKQLVHLPFSYLMIRSSSSLLQVIFCNIFDINFI